MLVKSSLNMIRRNCHHFTPSHISKKSVVNMNDIFYTVQNHNTEIAELHNQFAKLQKNINYKMAILEYKIFSAFIVNGVLTICLITTLQ